jgi:hypothetical protein
LLPRPWQSATARARGRGSIGPVAPRPMLVSQSIRKELLSLGFGLRRGFAFLRPARAGLLSDSGTQPKVVRTPGMDDHHALLRDDILADVFAVITAAHFDYDHHLSKLAIDLHIAQPDNVISEKRNSVTSVRLIIE